MENISLSLLLEWLVDASESMQEMEPLLFNLLEEPDSTELVNQISRMSELIRPIYSFKGAEQFISQQGLSLLAFQLEELLDLLTKNEHPDSAQVMELFLLSRDLISRLTESLESMQLRVW